MRVPVDGITGELTVAQVATRHFKDSSKPGGVQKFYRALRLRFLSDDTATEKFLAVQSLT